MIKKSCKTCEHFKFKIDGTQTRLDEIKGTCLRYPPQMIVVNVPQGVSVSGQSPLVQGDYYCGEYQLAGKND